MITISSVGDHAVTAFPAIHANLADKIAGVVTGVQMDTIGERRIVDWPLAWAAKS